MKCENIPVEVAWILQRCDGYLDLSLREKALAELDRVPTGYRDSLPYLDLLLRLKMDVEDWESAAEVARLLRDRLPDRPAYWVQLAYATRRSQDIPAARSVLAQARSRFRDVAVIPYNLACYECRLGETEAAMLHLKAAIDLDPSFEKVAEDDEDLEPLWERIYS